MCVFIRTSITRYDVVTAVRMTALFLWVVTLNTQVDTNVSEKHTVFIFTAEDGDAK
jgi:hypothetical protein